MQLKLGVVTTNFVFETTMYLVGVAPGGYSMESKFFKTSSKMQKYASAHFSKSKDINVMRGRANSHDTHKYKFVLSHKNICHGCTSGKALFSE